MVVKDLVLVQTHPISSSSKKIVGTFKPYEVVKVGNNNVVIWKLGKQTMVNVDQVWIYHQRERDEGVVESEGSDNNSSKATQLETEGDISLNRERNNMVEKWRDKRKWNDGSTESFMKLCQFRQEKKGCRKELTGRKVALPHRGRTTFTSREDHLETTSSIRGVYPPLFILVHQQGRGSEEQKSMKDMFLYRESSPCPPKKKKKKRCQQKTGTVRKEQSGPDESSQGDQALMTYRADISPVEGRSNPGCPESNPTSDGAREQSTRRPILNREIKVSRIYEKTTQAGDPSLWRFSVGNPPKRI
ncbi:hypothetical protein TNCV_1519991 [Trichonephila clavipes]|nr:hypothetical protein TNCV_1519991 [Trichonephila clavipes]